jgi:hypothetical protein
MDIDEVLNKVVSSHPKDLKEMLNDPMRRALPIYIASSRVADAMRRRGMVERGVTLRVIDGEVKEVIVDVTRYPFARMELVVKDDCGLGGGGVRARHVSRGLLRLFQSHEYVFHNIYYFKWGFECDWLSF